MNTKKFWLVLTRALILVCMVLMVPLSSPAYAQGKTHLGVSPADMVILNSSNQGVSPYTFKRVLPNNTIVDFDMVPAGKCLIITDISCYYGGADPMGRLTIGILDITEEWGPHVWLYNFPLYGENTNDNQLYGNRYAFTSGIMLYPLHKVGWTYGGPAHNAGLIQVYLYGYLIDAPQIRPLRPPVPPPQPPVD